MSTTPNPAAAPPPPAVPTLYDETNRGMSAPEDPALLTLSPGVNLIAFMEHHDPTTDGSFGICVSNTCNINAIDQAVFESIPLLYRPALDATETHKITITLSFGMEATALGRIFFPIILLNKQDDNPVRIVVSAYVMPKLVVPMLMKNGYPIVGSKWGGGTVTWEFKLGGRHRRMVQVEGYLGT
ncbi:hypothetical protein FRB95_004383 [Tulasnella sp. JGI-2019a]|nr:hypothetical protein FRB95_004383 [Tulasnella sp. JGI-2019a]